MTLWVFKLVSIGAHFPAHKIKKIMSYEILYSG